MKAYQKNNMKQENISKDLQEPKPDWGIPEQEEYTY